MFTRLLALESLLENPTNCPKKSEDVQNSGFSFKFGNLIKYLPSLHLDISDNSTMPAPLDIYHCSYISHTVLA